MKNQSRTIGIFEIVNTALAIFSWLLPDLNLEIKVVITLTLIGMIVMSHYLPVEWTKSISFVQVGVLWMFSAVISLVMFWLAGQCYSGNYLYQPPSVLEGGLVFGSIVVLPISFIAMFFSRLGLSEKQEDRQGWHWIGLFASYFWYILAELIILRALEEPWRMSLYSGVAGPFMIAAMGDLCTSTLMMTFSIISMFILPAVLYFLSVIIYNRSVFHRR